MQTLVKVFAICLPLLFMCGCAFLSSLFGVNPDGTVQPGGGPMGTIASLVNLWIPGTTVVVGGITTLIAALKAKDWKKVATSTFDVIEAGAKAGKSVADLKGKHGPLAVAHAAAGVAVMADKAVQEIKPK